MIREIVQRDHPVLRDIAKEVPVEAIKTAKIQGIISNMKKALATQEDGVAIAAPQIGEPLRIFVISAKTYREAMKSKVKIVEDMVFINPKISSLSRDKKFMDEGCLSVRYLYGKVKRSNKATIKAYNEKGNEFTKRGEGLLAQIFQHEFDHLEGVLFIDKAKDLEDLPPEKLKQKHEHHEQSEV